MIGDIVRDAHEFVKCQNDPTVAPVDELRRDREILVTVALSGPQCGRIGGHHSIQLSSPDPSIRAQRNLDYHPRGAAQQVLVAPVTIQGDAAPMEGNRCKVDGVPAGQVDGAERREGCPNMSKLANEVETRLGDEDTVKAQFQERLDGVAKDTEVALANLLASSA